MKKFKYMGTFKNTDELPVRNPMPEGTVPFKEADDMKQLTSMMTVVSLIILILTMAIVVVRVGFSEALNWKNICIAGLLSLITLFPHEFLHAICMNGTVYCYSNLKMGSAFVLSNDDMSKLRFIVCSFCPNIVFGLIPFVIFLINPTWSVLGILGAFCISMGAGDYYNIYNAITQMPKGSLTFLSGMKSYWYLPKK